MNAEKSQFRFFCKMLKTKTKAIDLWVVNKIGKPERFSLFLLVNLFIE